MEGRATHYAPLYSLSLLLARLWGRASAQHRRQPLQRVVCEGQKVRLKFLYVGSPCEACSGNSRKGRA